MKFFLYFFILGFSYLAEASSEGIPLKEIFFQVLNFSLFLGLFLFLLKKPIQNLYKQRRKDFLLFEEQARKQKEEMETSLKVWEEKIKELDLKKKTIKQEAEKEGKKLMIEKTEEIEDLRKRLSTEMKFFIHLESEKIKQESLKSWQKKIVKKAREVLKKTALDAQVQKKLYKDFFKQIEDCQ